MCLSSPSFSCWSLEIFLFCAQFPCFLVLPEWTLETSEHLCNLTWLHACHCRLCSQTLTRIRLLHPNICYFGIKTNKQKTIEAEAVVLLEYFTCLNPKPRTLVTDPALGTHSSFAFSKATTASKLSCLLFSLEQVHFSFKGILFAFREPLPRTF